MRLFRMFARAYPSRIFLTAGFLLLAVLVEGIGISMLLTLLVVVTSDEADPGVLDRGVRAALDWLGVEPALGPLLGLFFVAMLLRAACQLLSKQQVGYTVARIATDFRLLLVRALAGARWGYFTEQPVGVLSSSLSSEVTRAGKAYLELANVLSLSAQALLYASIALVVSWQVTLAGAVAATVGMRAVRYFIRRTRRVGRERTRVARSLLKNLSDGLQAVKPLKAMGRETRLGPVLEKDTRRLKRLMRSQVLLREAVAAVQEPMTALFIVAGVYSALTWWSVPVTELVVLVVLFNRTVIGMTKAQRSYQGMVLDEPAVWALREQFERAAAHREEPSGSREPRLERGISLGDVALRYGDNRVLDGVTLEIPAGGITAVVGPSGAGKTSLADIVVGLVRPDRGSVQVDGVALDELDQQAWRRGIGYVPQEIFLVNDSVRENVVLGEDVSDRDVELALRRAGAWDFVSRLPQGVDTSVGERGSLLSGGQRQRICIARALVHSPRLLILDEATTALDPDTEAHILETIRGLRGELTVLAISHQPALVSIADRVFRIEGGKVERADPTEDGKVERADPAGAQPASGSPPRSAAR